MMSNFKHAIGYAVATYLVSFGLVALYFRFGGHWKMPGSLILSIGYMFVPMLVALVYQKYLAAKAKPLGVRFRLNRWFVVAWLLPPLLAIGTLGVSLALPGIEYSAEMKGLFSRLESLFSADQVAQMKQQMESLPVHPMWVALVQGLVAGATINAVAGFGEELGW